MATKEHTTRVSIEAKARGFDQTQRKAKDLAKGLSPEALSKGFQRMEHFMGKVEKQFGGLDRHMKRLNENLGKMTKAVEGVEKFASGLDKAKKAAQETNRELSKMQSRGGFAQGFLQQMGFGPFMQRGPGMGRQAAGQVAGGMARAPFRGLGGISQGVANIPGIGLLAGPLQAAIGGAGRFLDIQRAQMQLAGGMGISGALTAGQEAARAALSPQEATRRVSSASGRAFRKSMFQGRPGAPLGIPMPSLTKPSVAQPLWLLQQQFLENTPAGQALVALNQAGPTRPETDAQQNRRIAKANVVATGAAIKEEQRIAGERAFASRQAQQSALFGMPTFGGPVGGRQVSVAGIAGQFGLTAQQGLQRQVQMRQAGGVTPGRGVFELGLAAQAEFGAGPGVAGAFIRAQRQGGLATRRATETEAFAAAIGQATGMGLEQSEIGDHLRTVAQGITEFRTTGIPFAGESIMALSRGLQLGTLGQLRPTRAAAIAGGITRRGQAIAAAGGPSTDIDFMLMRQAGFRGGMVSYVETLEKLRTGRGITGATLTGIIQQRVGGTLQGRTPEERATAQFAIQRIVQGFGGAISMGPGSEAELLRREAAGTLSPKEQEQRRTLAAKFTKLGVFSPENAGEIVAKTADKFKALTPALLESTKNQSEQARLGGKNIEILNDLEKQQTNLIKSVSVFSKEIGDVTGLMVEASALLPGMLRAMTEFALNFPEYFNVE